MTTPTTLKRRHWRLGPGALVARPRLVIAAAAGLVVGFGCSTFAPQLGSSSCAVAGWDAFCLIFLALTYLALTRKGPTDMRAQAAREDQGQAVILLMILAASVISLAAVALEFSRAQAVCGSEKALHVTAGVMTLAASWLLMQVVFALHYAHEYYAVDPTTGEDAEGLAFPGGEAPDYWDFLHFSIVIGVASQTADVAFTRRPMRRLGTAHSVIAFTFNTLIVALAINLVAGLLYCGGKQLVLAKTG